MKSEEEVPCGWQGLGQGELPGDLLLELPDGQGQLHVHSQFLKVSSPVFSTALAEDVDTEACNKLPVTGTMAAWRAILARLYPMHPRPKLTASDAYEMLPVVHMYDMRVVQAKVLSYLAKHFPQELSVDPGSPCYVMRWLALADQLKLEAIEEMCMSKIRDMAHKRQLEAVLLASVPRTLRTVPRVTPLVPRPPGYGTCNGYNHGSDCVQWCINCNKWTCTEASKYAQAATGSVGGCNICRQNLRSQHQQPGVKARWFQDDRPKLADDLKSLSRDTLEAVLASVVAVTGGEYCNAPLERASMSGA
mmetsp:Transcript_21783/g.65153  ORF Transcript_21783/g.65153 Transcript_21783/m.65153 type:complete len:305 (-) Transcript_21783:162-1076(-)